MHFKYLKWWGPMRAPCVTVTYSLGTSRLDQRESVPGQKLTLKFLVMFADKIKTRKETKKDFEKFKHK